MSPRSFLSYLFILLLVSLSLIIPSSFAAPINGCDFYDDGNTLSYYDYSMLSYPQGFSLPPVEIGVNTIKYHVNFCGGVRGSSFSVMAESVRTQGGGGGTVVMGIGNATRPTVLSNDESGITIRFNGGNGTATQCSNSAKRVTFQMLCAYGGDGDGDDASLFPYLYRPPNVYIDDASSTLCNPTFIVETRAACPVIKSCTWIEPMYGFEYDFSSLYRLEGMTSNNIQISPTVTANYTINPCGGLNDGVYTASARIKRGATTTSINMGNSFRPSISLYNSPPFSGISIVYRGGTGSTSLCTGGQQSITLYLLCPLTPPQSGEEYLSFNGATSACQPSFIIYTPAACPVVHPPSPDEPSPCVFLDRSSGFMYDFSRLAVLDGIATSEIRVNSNTTQVYRLRPCQGMYGGLYAVSSIVRSSSPPSSSSSSTSIFGLGLASTMTITSPSKGTLLLEYKGGSGSLSSCPTTTTTGIQTVSLTMTCPTTPSPPPNGPPKLVYEGGESRCQPVFSIQTPYACPQELPPVSCSFFSELTGDLVDLSSLDYIMGLESDPRTIDNGGGGLLNISYIVNPCGGINHGVYASLIRIDSSSSVDYYPPAEGDDATIKYYGLGMAALPYVLVVGDVGTAVSLSFKDGSLDEFMCPNGQSLSIDITCDPAATGVPELNYANFEFDMCNPVFTIISAAACQPPPPTCTYTTPGGVLFNFSGLFSPTGISNLQGEVDAGIIINPCGEYGLCKNHRGVAGCFQYDYHVNFEEMATRYIPFGDMTSTTYAMFEWPGAYGLVITLKGGTTMTQPPLREEDLARISSCLATPDDFMVKLYVVCGKGDNTGSYELINIDDALGSSYEDGDTCTMNYMIISSYGCAVNGYEHHNVLIDDLCTFSDRSTGLSFDYRSLHIPQGIRIDFYTTYYLLNPCGGLYLSSYAASARLDWDPAIIRLGNISSSSSSSSRRLLYRPDGSVGVTVVLQGGTGPEDLCRARGARQGLTLNLVCVPFLNDHTKDWVSRLSAEFDMDNRCNPVFTLRTSAVCPKNTSSSLPPSPSPPTSAAGGACKYVTMYGVVYDYSMMNYPWGYRTSYIYGLEQTHIVLNPCGSVEYSYPFSNITLPNNCRGAPGCQLAEYNNGRTVSYIVTNLKYLPSSSSSSSSSSSPSSPTPQSPSHVQEFSGRGVNRDRGLSFSYISNGPTTRCPGGTRVTLYLTCPTDPLGFPEEPDHDHDEDDENDPWMYYDDAISTVCNNFLTTTTKAACPVKDTIVPTNFGDDSCSINSQLGMVWDLSLIGTTTQNITTTNGSEISFHVSVCSPSSSSLRNYRRHNDNSDDDHTYYRLRNPVVACEDADAAVCLVSSNNSSTVLSPSILGYKSTRITSILPSNRGLLVVYSGGSFPSCSNVTSASVYVLCDRSIVLRGGGGQGGAEMMMMMMTYVGVDETGCHYSFEHVSDAGCPVFEEYLPGTTTSTTTSSSASATTSMDSVSSVSTTTGTSSLSSTSGSVSSSYVSSSSSLVFSSVSSTTTITSSLSSSSTPTSTSNSNSSSSGISIDDDEDDEDDGQKLTNDGVGNGGDSCTYLLGGNCSLWAPIILAILICLFLVVVVPIFIIHRRRAQRQRRRAKNDPRHHDNDESYDGLSITPSSVSSYHIAELDNISVTSIPPISPSPSSSSSLSLLESMYLSDLIPDTIHQSTDDDDDDVEYDVAFISGTWQGARVSLKRVWRGHEVLNEECLLYVKRKLDILRPSRHPNLAMVYGLWRDVAHDGDTYLVLEHFPEGNLTKYLQNLPEDTPRDNLLIQMTRELASGLSYLISLGITHDDLQLGNIDARVRVELTTLKITNYYILPPSYRLSNKNNYPNFNDSNNALSVFKIRKISPACLRVPEMKQTMMMKMKACASNDQIDISSSSPILSSSSSPACDVWCFAVLLCEMYTLCDDGVSAPEQTSTMTTTGGVSMPVEIARIVDHCLHSSASLRPSMRDVDATMNVLFHNNNNNQLYSQNNIHRSNSSIIVPSHVYSYVTFVPEHPLL